MTAEAVRTGVCVIRAEGDGPSGLRITVTSRPDICADAEAVHLSTGVDEAVAVVRRFLLAFAGSGP